MAYREALMQPAPPGTICYAWGPIQQGDTCGPAEVTGYPDVTMQIVGVYSGMSVAVVGRMDHPTLNETHYAPVQDFAGQAVAFTANKLVLLQQSPDLLTLQVTGGDGTTALYAVLKGNAPR